MNIDSIQDSTRVVLSELRHGSIIPGNRAEMWRELFLLPGADLRGSAFGKSLYVEGPDVNVEASIYVRESIKVAESDKEGIQSGNVTFGSCVTTPDSIWLTLYLSVLGFCLTSMQVLSILIVP